MGLPQNLLALCKNMLPGDKQWGRPDAATLKRSISTAYYSVFSLLVHAAASMLAGNGSERKELRGYVASAFDHYEMAEACNSLKIQMHAKPFEMLNVFSSSGRISKGVKRHVFSCWLCCWTSGSRKGANYTRYTFITSSPR
jgi:hypothetical protein